MKADNKYIITQKVSKLSHNKLEIVSQQRRKKIIRVLSKCFTLRSNHMYGVNALAFGSIHMY